MATEQKLFTTPNGAVVDATSGSLVQASPNAINSAMLQQQPTYDFKQASPTPVFPVSSIPDAQLTQQETKASDMTTRLQELNNQLLGQSEFQKQQEQAQGLPELQNTQNELSSRLTAIKNEAMAIPLQLQQESIGRGRTVGGLRPIETAALRNNAIQALSTSSLLEASRGNLALAQDRADKAVAQRFDPIKEQIAVAQANLDLILKDPRTSLEDKNRAAQQKAIQDAKLAATKKQEEQEAAKSKAILDYAGLTDALTLRQMQNAPDAATVLQIAFSKGLVTPEQAKLKLDELKTRADIAKINADISLTNAQKAKVLAEVTPVAENAKKALQNNEALTIAKEILKPDAVGKSTAVGASLSKLLPYARDVGLQGDRVAFEAKVNTLKANLTLDSLKLLKGPMSDKDLLFLNSIGSSLDTNMSVGEFDKEVKRIVDKLESAGATAVEPVQTSPQIPEGYYQASDGLYYKK